MSSKTHERRGGSQAARNIDEVAQRDRLHPFVDDRGVAIVERDDGEEVLMAQRAEHAHVVADLAAATRHRMSAPG